MLRFLRSRVGDERGIALVAVIAIGSVIAILVVSAVALAIGGLSKARNDQDWNAALAAAYAGVEEYQSRLASDSTYFQYGHPSAPFTGATASEVTLPTGADKNPAFGVGATGDWAAVAGTTQGAEFRYEVDNSKYGADGTIRIRSTGRVGGETRSIVADLKQKGFIDFLYFTNYEIQDPEVSGESASCATYAWAGRDSDCRPIDFGPKDTINGPAHSNDTLRICGSTFKGKVTTAWDVPEGTRRFVKPSYCGEPTFEVDNEEGERAPGYSPVVGMPATNAQLKKETRTDLPDVSPGCLYTGPTKIVFTADGNMRVTSPWSNKTRVSGDPVSAGKSPNECGRPGKGVNQLGSKDGAKVKVPENKVIYVQNVPNVADDPNKPTDATRNDIKCTGESKSVLGNAIGFPKLNEDTYTEKSYQCDKGDVFVQGTVDGALTIAAENYIYVTGDVKYEDPDSDILGLIGNNAVWVWNPIRCTYVDKYDNCVWGTSLLGGKDRRIDAAILSVSHTFQVQHYSLSGKRGILTVNGAIAQNFRGAVGSAYGSTLYSGYEKNYQYDPRLTYTAPPKFLSPVTITYGVNVWVEVTPAFDSTGAART